jgi:signal recognition particle subunit SEC65
MEKNNSYRSEKALGLLYRQFKHDIEAAPILSDGDRKLLGKTDTPINPDPRFYLPDTPTNPQLLEYVQQLYYQYNQAIARVLQEKDKSNPTEEDDKPTNYVRKKAVDSNELIKAISENFRKKIFDNIVHKDHLMKAHNDRLRLAAALYYVTYSRQNERCGPSGKFTHPRLTFPWNVAGDYLIRIWEMHQAYNNPVSRLGNVLHSGWRFRGFESTED